MVFNPIYIYILTMVSFISSNPPMAVLTMLFIIAFFLPYLRPTEAQVGVCYGRLGSNLPSPEQVVKLFKDNSIREMRLYEPDLCTLEALQGTGIKLMLGVRNAHIQNIGSNQSAADEWVEKFVAPYVELIKYIAVGNEITPSDKEAPYVTPAMKNILSAVNNMNANQQTQISYDIKVSTAISTGLIKNSEASPSEAEFINMTYISPIIQFLSDNDSPLLANIQPYLAYKKGSFELKYLIFTAGDSVLVTDRNNHLKYHNMFDAMLDSVYAAIGKVSAAHINARGNRIRGTTVVSSEAGVSSKGGFHSHNNGGRMSLTGYGKGGIVQQESIGLRNSDANTFYANLIEHVRHGTPLKPGEPIETYLFAMFDENLKGGDETENYYGLYTPDRTPKYQKPTLKFS